MFLLLRCIIAAIVQFPDVGLIKALFFFIVRHQGGDIKNIRLEKYEADHQMDQSGILANPIFLYQKLDLLTFLTYTTPRH